MGAIIGCEDFALHHVNYRIMEYISHLSKDKKFATLLKGAEPFKIRRRKNVFLYLCASIMSQQLSTKVAAVIYNRFIELYHGYEPEPQEVLLTPSPELRAIGLSNAKVSYVQNVARFAVESGMDFATLQKMNDEEVIVYLTTIKGVGRWTVEMLLMSALGREDVFAVDDLGIQQAMIKMYNWRN